MTVFSVLIIGAGKIGAFFDNPEKSEVLTHAHAFCSHNGFRLIGFIDVESKQADKAAAVWGGNAFSTIPEAFARQIVDVVVVAAPDNIHYSLLKEIAAYKPKLVFSEKPLTKRLEEAEEIVRLYKEQNIVLGVNYTRRFVPEFVILRNEIRIGKFGKFLAGNGYYGKGTLHNGSHLVDLLRFLIGEIAATRTITKTHDYLNDDPSCTAVLNMAVGGEFIMQAVNCHTYTIFEIDLHFEKKRVRMTDSGLRIEKYDVIESSLFEGYRIPVFHKASDTGLKSAIRNAAEMIYSQLLFGEKFCCSGEDAILTQKVCSSILGER